MWSGTQSLADNGAHYYLTVRTERPVEGCELMPYAFLQIKGGVNWDNAMRQRILESNPFTYHFTWHRSPPTVMCSNTVGCPRNKILEPLHWTKAALGGPSIMCNICYRAGRNANKCSFCSLRCFKDAWREHCSEHTNLPVRSKIGGNSPSVAGMTAAGAEQETVQRSTIGTEKGIAMGDDVVEKRSRSNTVTSSNSNSFFNAEGDEVSEDGEKWTLVSQERIYTPQADDLGCRLRVAVRAVADSDNSVLAGPVFAFTAPVLSAPTAPPKRTLHTVAGSGAGIAGAPRFRIVSYNILAEQYATSQAYPYCDTWALGWAFRRKLLEQELEEMQGDIVCLQEVQADHYEQHLHSIMEELGYDGIYKAKSREYSSQYGKVDGCATFWKRSKFIMTENYSIEFNNIARNEVTELGLDDLEARKYMTRLCRDNVAQIVVLEPLQRTGSRSSSGSLCVVNTHLYSNHQRGDVKLWQTLNLLREVRQFIAQRDLPLLLTGDFNSEPSSAVYELLLHGMISDGRPELDPSCNNGVHVLPNWQSIMHDIELASAMSAVYGQEPQYTNYTAKFKGTLDYIFYSPSRFRVLAVSGIPEENDLRQTSGEGLPSACYPSDHVSLCCDIAMVASGSGSVLNVNHPGLGYGIDHHQHMHRQHSGRK